MDNYFKNSLTGLWTREKLQKDAQEALGQGNQYLIYMNVDNLATINMAHGRKYGDGLLCRIADYLKETLGDDSVYQVDNHNFAMLVNARTEEEVREIYDGLSEEMYDKCTFTAGVVPVSSELFTEESQLWDCANMTLKKAKEISNNRIEFFSPEDLAKKIQELALLEDMMRSVEEDYRGFEVYYQPQVRVGDYEIYGVEALLRYTSPRRGMVYPNEFIPILEQSGMIRGVGLWALEQALLQCKKWRELLPTLRVSVNFSLLQFEDSRLAEKVLALMQRIGLNGEVLTVEITETVELHNLGKLQKTIRTLREAGVNFSIDDFGTGYSNLGYLQQLQVDEIKIDRVFVKGIEQGTYNHKLISNVLEFAKVNSIRTCCEGVESIEELVTLELLFPDVIQGYLFDKPNSADIIERIYLCPDSSEYAERMKFLEKLRTYTR